MSRNIPVTTGKLGFVRPKQSAPGSARPDGPVLALIGAVVRPLFSRHAASVVADQPVQ